MMLLNRRTTARITLTSALCVALASLACADCSVTLKTTGAQPPDIIAIGENVHVDLGLDHDDPTPTDECAVDGPSYAWEVLEVSYDAGDGTPTRVWSPEGSEENGDLRDAVELSGGGDSDADGGITLTPAAPGYWYAQVRVTAAWDGRPKDSCSECPDCPSCKAVAFASIGVLAVGVKKIIVLDSDPENSGPLTVCLCQDCGGVELKAVSDPPDTTFPEGTPIWTYDVKPDGVGRHQQWVSQGPFQSDGSRKLHT